MLTPDEELRLVEIFSGSVVPKVARTMLQQVHLKPSCRGAVETEKIALMKRELMDCQGNQYHSFENWKFHAILMATNFTDLAEYPDVVVEHLHNLWQDIQYRIFFFHETAVNAYFKFIDLGDDSSEDKSISATLRLLQLTVKHALELQESIQVFSIKKYYILWWVITSVLFLDWSCSNAMRKVESNHSTIVFKVITEVYIFVVDTRREDFYRENFKF